MKAYFLLFGIAFLGIGLPLWAESPSVRCVQCSIPIYPSNSKARGEQGEVVLSLDVNNQGKVIAARIHSSSGFPDLDQSALTTALEWQFTVSEQGRLGILARIRFQTDRGTYP